MRAVVRPLQSNGFSTWAKQPQLWAPPIVYSRVMFEACFTHAIPWCLQVCLITGGNAGIGYATAKKLAQRGAHVILACRSHQRGQEAVKVSISCMLNQRCDTAKHHLDSLTHHLASWYVLL